MVGVFNIVLGKIRVMNLVANLEAPSSRRRLVDRNIMTVFAFGVDLVLPIFHLINLLPLLARSTRRGISRLIRHQQARDARARQCAQRSRNQGRNSQPTDIATTTRGNLRQHADLSAQGPDIREAAESVGGNETGARGEVCVGWIRLEVRVGDKLVLDLMRGQ